MNKTEKQKEVANIEKIYNNASSVIITHYHGLTVKQLTDLRNKLRENNSGFKVVKNTLAKIAAKNTKSDFDFSMFAGPVGIAYSEDAVMPAKTITAFTKDNEKLTVIGGLLDNKSIDVAYIAALSKLPSLDEIRGNLVGILNAPAQKLMRTLSAPASNIVNVTSAYSKK